MPDIGIVCDKCDRADKIVETYDGYIWCNRCQKEVPDTGARGGQAGEKNMYDCAPCPTCGSKYRWPSRPDHPEHPSSIICDECGHVQPVDAPGPIQGINPMDLPGKTTLLEIDEHGKVTDVTPDTAADLARYFTGPWCKQCSTWASDACFHHDGLQVAAGLHTRCPETRVEGLFHSGDRWWFGLLGRRQAESVAADLLVMGVVREAGEVQFTYLDEKWHVGLGRLNGVPGKEWFDAEAPTHPQAVALARHRAADSEEA